MASPAPIPRRLLFGNPRRSSVEVSRDGTSLAWLAPDEGVLNVWVAPVSRPGEARPVTRDRGRGIRFFCWTEQADTLLYLQDRDGDEGWHVYRVDLSRAEADILDLTPIDGVQGGIQSVSPEVPGEVILAVNDRDRASHDLYRVNLRSGERALVVRNEEGFAGIVTDARYRPRFAVRGAEDGGWEYLIADGQGGWRHWLAVPQEDAMTTSILGFDRPGSVLYCLSSLGRDTAALYAIREGSADVSSWQLLAADPRSDAESVLFDPRDDTPLAVSFTYERKRWECLNEEIASDLDLLAAREEGELHIVSQSGDNRVWIVRFAPDDGPHRYYVYHRSSRQLLFLFTNRPELEGLMLAKMHPVVITARDGLELVCYYSLPPGSAVRRDNCPDEPLPMVLHVHGGPWGRDSFGFSPYHQWFADRGYAVLSVNFRGSTGFGKRVVNAGDREWAGRMHDDLIDAVAWAVEQGIADPDLVAIHGTSYGGYAALTGLTFTPEFFACGVSVVGPSSLCTLLDTIPPYWKPILQMFTSRVGDPSTPEGREFLWSRSPLSRVDAIRRPLLIGQGANDPRVRRAESDQIVTALREKGIAVTYLLYPDEGHGFARPENRLSFCAVAEAFLGKVLGGRIEPIGEDFRDSSLRSLAGEDLLPELKTVSGT